MKNLRIPLALPLLFALMLSFVFLYAPSLSAQAPDAALIRRVDNHYNRLHTLRARYTEHYTGMGLDRTESGTLTLEKPGLMRWAYDTPPGKLFVLDRRFAWFYTPGDAQVSRAPAKEMDDLRSPLRLLLGHTRLDKELDHLATSADGTDFKITGVPRGMADRIHRLTLVVSPTGVIKSLKIEETDGATTAFTFTDIEENIPLPPSNFVFTPPPGIPIVNAQPPI